MLALTVCLFITFGAVELRRVGLDAQRTVELERAAREDKERIADSAPRLLEPFHTSERARRAYAIRCSCDGRDS